MISDVMILGDPFVTLLTFPGLL